MVDANLEAEARTVESVDGARKAHSSAGTVQNLRVPVKLYRLASVINDGPLKLVSEQLGVSVSTATRMMNRARIAGLVDEATGREVLVQACEQQLREQFNGPAAGPRSSGPSIGR